MHKPAFVTSVEHFETLVTRLEEDERSLFHTLKAVRVETAYKGRNFIVYSVDEDGEVTMLDKFVVLDYNCDEEIGASTELRSLRTNETVVIGYSPVQLPGVNVMAWLPLHSRVNWDAIPDSDRKEIVECSLGFNICVKTRSRRHLLETGVHHCETGRFFGEHFSNVADSF